MSARIEKSLNGRCLCGAVSYSATATFDKLEACHCSQCTRWTGSFFVATTVMKAKLKFIRDDGLKWYESSKLGRRGFCNKCGSSLFWEKPGGDEIDILAGSLDQPTGMKITGHIYVADIYDITDAAPQYPQSRPTA